MKRWVSIGVGLGASLALARGQTALRHYPRFFPGKRWEIAFGEYAGVQKFAVDEVQRLAQSSFPYVMEVEPATRVVPKDAEHLIIVGTLKNNRLLRDLVRKGVLAPPTRPQGYSISVVDSPWKPGQRIIAIAGSDPNGVLYGVEEFNAQVLGYPLSREAFDSLPDFSTREAPAITNRGIWCWGYVIYDYRRFLDNMARLKLNTLIFWNDTPPYNCRDIIEYAHSRGVRVILGFQWGYGIEGLDPTSAVQRAKMKREVLTEFNTNYRGLGMDGIYFQTFTENSTLSIKGRTTAQWACDWVNEIASALLKVAPGLRIEFGLHGTSIRQNYADLKPLDRRVVITWEDAGTLPYTYDPVAPKPEDAASSDPYRSLSANIEHSQKLGTFRPGTEFSMVAKGWIQLPWQTSEHHPPYILGERDSEWIKSRLEQRQSRWDFVNDLWNKNYPLAAQFYRQILESKPAGVSVSGLVEDGMLEEHIPISVVIFAETLWNPFVPNAAIAGLSGSPYFRR